MMDFDQLKLVVDMVGQLGGSASTLVMWWIVLGVVVKAVGIAAISGVVVYIVRAISQFHLSENRNWEAIRAISVALGQPIRAYCDSNDLEGLLNRIEHLKNGEQK